MNKYDLLKSIGFSEEYISHLKKLDNEENIVFESVADDYKPLSNDVSNIIVDQSITNFETRLILHPK